MMVIIHRLRLQPKVNLHVPELLREKLLVLLEVLDKLLESLIRVLDQLEFVLDFLHIKLILRHNVLLDVGCLVVPKSP